MRNYILLVLSVLWAGTFAQIPQGYYDDANGLSGEALKTALHNIIDDHNLLSYDEAKTALMILDEDPDNPDNVILIYKGTSIAKTEFGTFGDNWNREHLWPQSHGNFGTSDGAGTDVHSLRPCDASVNSSRGEKDFDNGGDPHPEATGCFSDEDSWEPRDAVKGDIARAMFYMAVRYEGDVSGEPQLILEDNTTGTSSGTGYLGVLSTLMSWHEDDPVDQAETDRNDMIYYTYQSNRNPFIDHPEYVYEIWGTGLAPEPSNHASGFSGSTITVNWSDAGGEILPDGYLVRMSSTGFQDIETPVDGVAVENDFYNKNVPYGTESCVFGQLVPGQTYFFKIFAYTGSGSGIDYKTSGTIPQISIIAR